MGAREAFVDHILWIFGSGGPICGVPWLHSAGSGLVARLRSQTGGGTAVGLILASPARNGGFARMIPRQKSQLVRARLDQFPAVALLGSRQVGTTLAELIAEERPSVYLDLEDAADREKLADAALYLSGHEDKLVILVLDVVVSRSSPPGRAGAGFFVPTT